MVAALILVHVGFTQTDITQTVSILPIPTTSTSICREVAAAFDAIRNTEDIETMNLTTMRTQIEAARSTGAKRIVSYIRIAERLDASGTLEDQVCN